MKRMKLTVITLIVLLFFAVGIGNAKCKAADSGEKFAAVYNVKKKSFGARSGKDSTEAIQKALDKAAKKGKTGKRAKVYVPAGTYYLSKTLSIDSNVYLQCDKNAKFIKKAKKGKRVLYMLRSAKHGKKGFNSVRNITVEGGCWDAKYIKFNKETGGSLFFFVHGQNLEFLNLTLKNNYGTHLLELGGDKNVIISGCKFTGFRKSNTDADKEAIQIDVCHNYEILPDAAPYDDTACENIVIENNEIYNYPRAVGSHTYIKEVYPINITIRNNNIHDISENAIYAYNYRNLTVDSNTFKNVFAAVVFKTRATEAKQTIYSRKKGVKAMPFADKIYNLNITNNDINTMNKSTAKYNNQFGVFVYGTPEFPINGVNISNNKIKSASSGMYLRYINDSVLDGNSVTRQNNYSAGKFLVDAYKFLTCRNSTITGNVVNNTSGNLYENGFAFREKCVNITVNGNTVYEVSKHGMGVYNDSSVVLENNSINKAGQHGIAVLTNSSIVTSGNNIYSSNDNGITITDSAKASLSKDSIIGNNSAGVSVTGSSDAKITGCTIKGNGGNGITIVSASSDSISENVIEGNGGTGLSVQNSSNVRVINANSLFSNTGKAIAINGSTAPKITNNVMLSNESEWELTATTSTTPVESFRTITANNITASSTIITGTCQPELKVYALINAVRYDCKINKKDYSITIPAQVSGTIATIIQEDASGNKVQINKTIN